MYLKKSLEERRSAALLKLCLDKRRKVLLNISTRLYEDERKRVEDELKDVGFV